MESTENELEKDCPDSAKCDFTEKCLHSDDGQEADLDNQNNNNEGAIPTTDEMPSSPSQPQDALLPIQKSLDNLHDDQIQRKPNAEVNDNEESSDSRFPAQDNLESLPEHQLEPCDYQKSTESLHGDHGEPVDTVPVAELSEHNNEQNSPDCVCDDNHSDLKHEHDEAKLSDDQKSAKVVHDDFCGQPDSVDVNAEPCDPEAQTNKENNETNHSYNGVGDSEGKPRKRAARPPWVPLEDNQLQGMEEYFLHCAYPTRSELLVLSDKIGLDFKRVNNWFKNQRQKLSRIRRGLTPGSSASVSPETLSANGDEPKSDSVLRKDEQMNVADGDPCQPVGSGLSLPQQATSNSTLPGETPKARFLSSKGRRKVLYKGLGSPKKGILQKKWKHSSSSLMAQGSKYSIYGTKRNPISMKRRRRRRKKLPPVPDAAATFERLKAVGWSPNKEPPDVNVPGYDLLALLTCGICHGYLFNATTLTECLHTFCKSCIVNHIQLSLQCPKCQLMIHPSNPTANMRSDSTMQDIVYKVFPHVEEAHITEQKEFYASRGIAWPPRPKTPELPTPEKFEDDEDDKDEDDELTTNEHQIPRGLLYILLDYIGASPGMGHYKPLVKRHLLVPSQATVGHLEKFLEQKLHVPNFARVRVFVSTFQLKSAVSLDEVAGAFPEHCPKEGLLEVDYGVVVRQPTPVKKTHCH